MFTLYNLNVFSQYCKQNKKIIIFYVNILLLEWS